MAKIIFLDVDGVLNNRYSKSRCSKMLGVDKDKVKRLRRIVDATEALIVLDSTWRLEEDMFGNHDTHFTKYLQKKLSQEQLRYVSVTPDLGRMGNLRGKEIKTWMDQNDDINIESWIVIDDEIFFDFEDEGIMPHLVLTEFDNENGGLQDQHIEKAITMLNGDQQ